MQEHQKETMRRTVVIDQTLNIPHNLGIAAVEGLGHDLERVDLIVCIMRIVRHRRLRIKDERDC